MSIAKKDVALMSGLEQAFEGAQTGWAAASSELADLRFKRFEGRVFSPAETARLTALEAQERELAVRRGAYGPAGYVATQAGHSAKQMGQSIYAMAQGAGYGGAAGAEDIAFIRIAHIGWTLQKNGPG